MCLMDGVNLKLVGLGVFVAFCCVVLGIGGCTMFIPAVQPGHIAVSQYFGKIEDEIYPAGGPYFKNPIKKLIDVNVQTTKNEEQATVPTKGGLPVSLKAIMLYHVEGAKAPSILREIGQNFEEKLIDPTFRNIVRDVCSEYDPEALYTSERTKLEAQVLLKCEKELGPKGFVIESVMLQDPVLPDVVRGRIEQKVAAEQDAIRMQSVFKQREQEGMATKRQKELKAEADVIEARGIAQSQEIIKKDLDDRYLVYQYIEALKEAAKHGHVIYVPNNFSVIQQNLATKPVVEK